MLTDEERDAERREAENKERQDVGHAAGINPPTKHGEPLQPPKQGEKPIDPNNPKPHDTPTPAKRD